MYLGFVNRCVIIHLGDMLDHWVLYSMSSLGDRMSADQKYFSGSRLWIGGIILAATSIIALIRFSTEFKKEVTYFIATGENRSDFFYGYDNAFKCVDESLPYSEFVGVYQSGEIRFEKQQINLVLTQFHIVPQVVQIETPTKYIIGFNLRESDLKKYKLTNYQRIFDCPLEISIYQNLMGE